MKGFTLAIWPRCLFAVAAPAAAPAAKPGQAGRQGRDAATDAVTVSGIMRHERALANIAERNGGTRASGTRGFDKSRDYVVGQLQNAGYTVNVQPFEFPFFQELAPSDVRAHRAHGAHLHRRRLRDDGLLRQRRRDRQRRPGRRRASARARSPRRTPAAVRPRTSPASPPARSRSSSAARAHSARRRRTQRPRARPPC